MGILREEKYGKTIGVYVHIPFCVSKCPYCDFKSTAAPHIPEDRYSQCLLKELSAAVKKEGIERHGRALQSIYMGGGTPSLFSPAAIGRIVEGVKSVFTPSKEIEVTLEANPGTIDPLKLRGFKKAGVNRLSIGVQSLNDSTLKTLGRTHNAQKAVKAFRDATDAGFENTGVDLIFGSPGETLKEWEETLLKAMELMPRHISLYGLTIEEGTPFNSLYKKGRRPSGGLTLPSEDEEARMYCRAVEILTRGGWLHYEISNFALDGHHSVHNRRYWLGGEYLGLGAGAHSYSSQPLWGRRRWNEADPSVYMRRVEEEGQATAGSESLDREEALTESLMLGLRMLDKGIDGLGFKKRFGLFPKEAFPGWKALEEEGLLMSSGEDLLLTAGGTLLSNEVFLRILS